MSDIGYIIAIASIFLILGTVIPLVQQDAGVPTTTQYLCNTGQIASNDISKCFTAQPSSWSTASTLLSIFLSILGMFTWSFGALPWWLDLIVFVPLRVAFIVLVARNFPQIEILGFKIGGSGGG